MNTHDNEHLEQLLRQSLPASSAHPRADLRRDLWPAMQRRLQQHSLSVPWFDWALLAALVAGVALFPGVIPVLLYHL